jgi:hypothetical protein
MTPPTSAAGRRWLISMGLALTIAGLIATGVLWTAYQKAAQTRSWTATPATIVSSQVIPIKKSASANTVFQTLVKYRYRISHTDYVGDRIKRDDILTGDYDKAQSNRMRFTPGQQLTCYVHPQQPELAVLEHRGRGALFSIWFPLLFVVGGTVMAWRAWRKPTA